ncbi:MAG: DUF998 domain-containing protein [Burkholderiales bacterium]
MLAITAAALFVATIVLFCWLHAVNRSVHVVRDAVSLFGTGSTAGLFRIYGHLGTAAIALFAIAAYLRRPGPLPSIVAIGLVVLVVARVAVIAVPTDAKGQGTSLRGMFHLFLAVIVFAATYTVIANAAPLFAAMPLKAALDAMQLLCMLSLAGVVVTMLPPLKRLFGLFERAFLLSMLIWFELASMSFALRPVAG